MKILTAAEMNATDKRTAEQFAVSLEQMMGRAGDAVARFVLRRYTKAKQIVVLCGKGNNGGDGFVAARVLWLAGRQVTVLLLGVAEDLRSESRVEYDRMVAEARGVTVHTVTSDQELAERGDAIEQAQLILDAVVGTGFKPPLRGVAVALQQRVQKATAPVVAVDLPSGWDADAVEMHAEGAFRADAVVTFTAPKQAHVFGQLTSSSMGAVVVAEIGSPEDAVQSELGLIWTGSAKTLAEQPRPANSNKGKFGHVLVIGGSRGKAGAPSMSSLAALRTGAGLVTAAVPDPVLNGIAQITPELMTFSLHEDEGGTIARENLQSPEFEALLKKVSVVAIGPGLSTQGDASVFARDLVAKTRVPMVVDADALNAFEGRVNALKMDGRVLVITPHPGEMARLIGGTVKEVEADRIGIAQKFAREQKVIVVLKGWRTVVAHPDGRTAINTTGNPAMAKGGSGDILTGIVAAMLAQYPDRVAEAVEAAVYLHGLAADFATLEMDEHTVLATDTLAHLSNAFRYRVRDEDGLNWISGVHA